MRLARLAVIGRRPAKLAFRPPYCKRFKHWDMASTTVNKTVHPFDKTRLDALLNRRFFYAPAFEIYGGESITVRSGSIYELVC